MSRDYAAEAQAAAEARLEALEALELDDEEGEGGDVDAAAPYCGCLTCVVREVLDAAYPILREAILAEEGA